jgi:hypothetical protein
MTPKVEYESVIPEQNVHQGIEASMNLMLDGISEEDED